MKKRYKMSKKRSRKSFTRSASRTHRINTVDYVMRGGLRL